MSALYTLYGTKYLRSSVNDLGNSEGFYEFLRLWIAVTYLFIPIRVLTVLLHRSGDQLSEMIK